MNIEIERKYLLRNEDWRGLAEGVYYKQAYLNERGGNTVRVRIEGEKAKLTIKGKALFSLAKTPCVEKYRHKIPYKGNVWEVDEFLGENKGLVVAEIELKSEEQTFEKPEWIGEEVTLDKRYTNSNLAVKPYSSWK